MKRFQATLFTMAAFILLGSLPAHATILASNITGQLQSDATAQRQDLFPGSGLSRDDTASDTLYIKWTVNTFDNQDTEFYYNGLTLADGIDGTGFKLGVGNVWDKSTYSTFGGGDLDLNSSNPNPTNGTSQLVVTNDLTTFVMRIDFNAAADDDVTIYLDPFLGTTELGQDTNLITTLSQDMSFLVIFSEGLSASSTGGGWYYSDAIVADDPLDIFSADADDDADGLPNTWELAYGLDPLDNGTTNINNGAIGDPDTDGSVNSNEFAKGTFPNDSDSDDDDLNDGDEETEGTDPLDPDTDGDYLSDGDEVNLHGTEPLMADTDLDGVNDATEVYCNSGPNDAGTQPTNNNPNIIGADFFDYLDGFIAGFNAGEFFDMDNNILNDIYLGHTCTKDAWYDTGFGSSASVTKQSLLTSSGKQGLRNFNGGGSGGTAVGVFSSDGATGSTTSNLYFKVDVTINNDSYAGLSLYNGGTERLFFGKTGGSGSWGIDGADTGGALESFTAPTNGEPYTLVGKVDIVNQKATLWINPNFLLGENSQAGVALDIVGPKDLVGAADITYTGLRLESGNASPVKWDNLIVAYTWDALEYTGVDTDVDGLRDAWENLWTNDLSVLSSGNDFDNDDLDDDEEQIFGTNPTATDADGDGLTDGEEISTYGTDPADADSDDDGLNDGFEVIANPYITDPNDADSDDDGYSDLIEINAGTNPLDPGDNSSTAPAIAMDGVLENLVYGSPVATQSVTTGFGDNLSEANAAYVSVISNKMYMFIAGNIQDNFNKIEIFFDANDKVTSNVLDTTDDDNGDRMDGMTFDTGFEPDIHCYFRRSGTEAFFDIIDLAAQTNSQYGSLFEGEGSFTTGTGPANSVAMEIAYNDSNTGGVVGSSEDSTSEAAPPMHWTNSFYGLELCIDLIDLGVPTGTVQCAVMINGSDRDYLSNQTLAGLPVGTGNLGISTNTSAIDFNLAPGNQFFSFAAKYVPDEPVISSIGIISGGSEVELDVSNLTPGVYYILQETSDLNLSFTDVTGSGYIASNETVTVKVSTSGAEHFFKAAAP